MSKRLLNLKKIKLYIFLSIILISCENKNSKSDFFYSWKDNYPENCYIRLKKDTSIENYIWFFDGTPKQENYLEGQLFFKNNSVFFKSKNYEKLEFILFDFNLQKGQCREVKYNKNINQAKCYNLCLDDFFYDELRKDTIYKFYFKHYSVYDLNTSISYFVGKDVGIIGCYLFNISDKDSILNISSKMVGVVYPNRYLYDKYPKFTIK